MATAGAVCGTLALVATGSLAQAAPAVAGRSCDLPTFGPGRDYHPSFDAKTFTPHVDNPFLPLEPGTTLIYAGTKDGKRAIDVFTVSSRTLKVDKVTTRVVEDRLFLDDVLEERTSDYYAQDACGNVWYFGEDTAQLDPHGKVVDRSGSFRAGVHGAQPGVFMQAHPMLGRRFRQEWRRGQAEDEFVAVDRHASVSVPYRSFRHALRTEENTALEPGVLDNKYYVRGIGEVKEIAIKGPVENLELVDVLS